MTAAELQSAALSRAAKGGMNGNYRLILEGFSAKGIPLDDILPRENIFTFQAWKALGRHVRKGEHGVKVCTFIETTRTEKDENGAEKVSTGRRPWTTTVFHVSQTEPNRREGLVNP
jgi:N-terminal domain of anti-restriction factor ArdC